MEIKTKKDIFYEKCEHDIALYQGHIDGNEAMTYDNERYLLIDDRVQMMLDKFEQLSKEE
jgi:hypothetical protein